MQELIQKKLTNSFDLSLSGSNILEELKLNKALNLAKKHTKQGNDDKARKIYQDILEKFPKNKRAADGIKTLAGKTLANISEIVEPPRDQFSNLVNLYAKGQDQQVLAHALQLLKQFPKSAKLYNIMGAAKEAIGKREEAIDAYSKAISINPNFVEAYSNMGNALKDQGKLKEALQAYTKAISIKPNFAEAHYNLGNAFKEQGKLEEAIEAYNKAISIKPDFAETYYNIGITLKDQGKLEEAIEPFTKAIAIRPDYAEAYFNMGVTLIDQGKLEEAIEAFTKAISIKPDYAEAHRSLSTIKQYTLEDEHFLQVKEIYRSGLLREAARCQLSFALAKMYEDIGDIEKSLSFLIEGNTLRKKFLNYSLYQDIEIFNKLKKTQPHLQKRFPEIKERSTDTTPVFILGMPRSGTTLVEQIISSHSEVIGAGELIYIPKFGGQLALNPEAINNKAILEFREQYLSRISKLSKGKQYVTDKMPHNFRFVPLICAALPEAKIVHVQRNATATCWSNYKQYFPAKNLGYCYDLSDVVQYYNLYTDLMKLWQSHYGDRIYNLSYECLTTDQENQTRKLISHLGLHWNDAFLSPQNNKRNVRTASHQQVRKKVYKGSSEVWRKYEPYLNGAFDSLHSS